MNMDLRNNQTVTEVSMVYHPGVGSILLITTIGSVFTNGVILYILITRHRSFLKRINLYLAVVCFLALTMSTFGCPMVISSSFAGYWLFGDIEILVVYFMGS